MAAASSGADDLGCDSYRSFSCCGISPLCTTRLTTATRFTSTSAFLCPKCGGTRAAAAVLVGHGAKVFGRIF
ncbi:MAG: DUF2752 domain-containing protein [Acidobacteria bacterium]|nr:DUF2752 domain-containing protein [Acidobacteriota bacterium]